MRSGARARGRLASSHVVVSSPRGGGAEQIQNPRQDASTGKEDVCRRQLHRPLSSAGVLVLATRVVDAYIMPLGGKALKKREQVRGPRPRPRGCRFRARGANAKAFATLQAKDAAAGIIRDEGVLRKMRTAKADVMCTICALAASDGSRGRRVARDRRGRSSARFTSSTLRRLDVVQTDEEERRREDTRGIEAPGEDVRGVLPLRH